MNRIFQKLYLRYRSLFLQLSIIFHYYAPETFLFLLVISFALVQRTKFIYLVLFFFVNLAIVSLLKLIINTKRPKTARVRIGNNLLDKRRFPSAHSWLSFYIAGFFLFYRPLFLVFLLIALVIAFSRIFLRVHDIVDVVFSSSIGLAIGMLISIFIFHVPWCATLI